MFTGLIEAVGEVLWLRKSARGITQLQLLLPREFRSMKRGESLAVNGCCLTLSALRKDQAAFDLLEETLERTNLRNLRQSELVNLERPLPADGRFGGHLVQGHVDTAAQALLWEEHGHDWRLEVQLEAQWEEFVVEKGSIAIDGISLTLAEVREDRFAVWIIPHTRRHTALHRMEPGRLVNLEFDIVAKYVRRLVGRTTAADQEENV